MKNDNVTSDKNYVFYKSNIMGYCIERMEDK